MREVQTPDRRSGVLLPIAHQRRAFPPRRITPPTNNARILKGGTPHWTVPRLNSIVRLRFRVNR